MKVADPIGSEQPREGQSARRAIARGRGGRWRNTLRSSPAAPVYGALIALFLLAWLIVALRGGSFLTIDNVVNMLQRSVALGIVAAGQTVVILAGSLDLSVAQLISLSSLLGAGQMDGSEANVIPAIALVLAVGAGVGLVNGLVITKLRVNAFIATLGMALVLQGVIANRWDGPYGSVPESVESFGYTRFGIVPMSAFLLLAVVAAVWFLLRYTRFGHHVYAVGGDEEVSRLSGLRTHRTIVGAHIICSLTAAITGLFLASRLGAGTPTVGPEGGYDLESIAAVVLGGTALMGGRGGVLGTLGGVFILAVLDNAFNEIGVNAFLKDVVRGVILIAAVAVYARRKGAQS